MLRTLLLATFLLATVSAPVRSEAQRSRGLFGRSSSAADDDEGTRPPPPRTTPSTKSAKGDDATPKPPAKAAAAPKTPAKTVAAKTFVGPLPEPEPAPAKAKKPAKTPAPKTAKAPKPKPTPPPVVADAPSPVVASAAPAKAGKPRVKADPKPAAKPLPAPDEPTPAARPEKPNKRSPKSKATDEVADPRPGTSASPAADSKPAKSKDKDKSSTALSKRKLDDAISDPSNDNKPKKPSGYRRPVPRYTYPNTKKRARYRIDVLASFYLNELVKNGQQAFTGKVPDKAQGALSFYEGVMLAADTLEADGYELDIHVHDITDPTASVDALLAADSFANSDLLIGAVQSAQIPKLAAYAKSHQINFVSALSPADGGVKDNPYFTLLQPSLQSHCDRIRKYVSRKQGNGTVVLLHHTGNGTDDFAYKQLSKLEGSKFKTLETAGLPDRKALIALLDSNDDNVLIIPALDGGYALSLLRHLAADYPQYRFHIYGMPSWRGLSFVRNADSTANMAISLTEPFYYDPTTPAAQALITSYAAQYNGKPTDLVYRGYETTLWYAYLLRKYGTIFNTHLSDNAAAPFTRFEVDDKKEDDGALMYLENHQLNMVHYDKGMYRVEY